MACEDHQEQVSRLIDNELGERESPALFAHLSACAGCRRFLHTMLQLRSGLQEQAPIVAPAHLDEKVLGALPVKQRFVPGRPAIRSILWKRRVSLPVPVAAAVVVLLMLGSIALSSLWFRSNQPQPELQTQTVYVTTLPAVEVRSYHSQPKTIVQ